MSPVFTGIAIGIILGAGAMALGAIVVTVVPNLGRIVSALRGEPVARETASRQRWRGVHRAGDRGTTFTVPEPDQPFWQPEHVLKGRG